MGVFVWWEISATNFLMLSFSCCTFLAEMAEAEK